MKVHYYRPIQERIREAKLLADRSSKRIDFIEITEDECKDLVTYSKHAAWLFFTDSPGTITSFYGVKIKVGDCK